MLIPGIFKRPNPIHRQQSGWRFWSLVAKPTKTMPYCLNGHETSIYVDIPVCQSSYSMHRRQPRLAVLGFAKFWYWPNDTKRLKRICNIGIRWFLSYSNVQTVRTDIKPVYQFRDSYCGYIIQCHITLIAAVFQRSNTMQRQLPLSAVLGFG